MFNELYPKFVLVDSGLIIARCTYHRDIVPAGEKCYGGGWWIQNEDTFTLYSSSDEFGYADLKVVQKHIDEGNVFLNSRMKNQLNVEDYQFILTNKTYI